jgi:hypothetical protein
MQTGLLSRKDLIGPATQVIQIAAACPSAAPPVLAHPQQASIEHFDIVFVPRGQDVRGPRPARGTDRDPYTSARSVTRPSKSCSALSLRRV